MRNVKNRIKSIEGTRQITKSMRLVSTSKVQKARGKMKANTPYWEEARRLGALCRGCLDGNTHPYVAGREVKTTLMVVLSGDRGLCGGYNVGVIRHALAQLEALGHPAKVMTIGSKARDFYRRRQGFKPLRSFTGMSESPFYPDVAGVAGAILELFDSGEVDEVLLACTEFESMLVQNPRVMRLLPIEEFGGEAGTLRFEPDGLSFLTHAVPFYLTAFLYGALLESAACEQSARITSMDGAVKTADEMIDTLSLRYNQARQGAITQEIIEIVGGAEAMRDL